MKVFFNPAYTNFVYQNLEKNPLQFDQKVCNTEALIDLLELHAGIHTSIKDWTVDLNTAKLWQNI